jgi:lysophospholipase L1-like esterase
MVLQEELGNDFNIIPEGLCGRTTCWDLPHLPDRNGSKFLPMILETHEPLDLVIIMLGINDLIKMLGRNSDDSAWGLFSLLRIILMSASGPNGTKPEMLVISPPSMGKLSGMMKLSYGGNEEESRMLAEKYKTACDSLNCNFLDSNTFIRADETDGVHISKETSGILGRRVAEKVRDILKN